MQELSYDIIGQSPKDVWLWVCIAAALVLLCYGLVSKLWKGGILWIRLASIAAALAGVLAAAFVAGGVTSPINVVWLLWALFAAAALVIILLALLLKPKAAGQWFQLAAVVTGLGLVIWLWNAAHSFEKERGLLLKQAALLGTFVMLHLVSLVFYVNLLPQLSRIKMVILLAIRNLALLMIVFMLFDPIAQRILKPAPTRPILFAIDASASMSVPDVQNGPTRMQEVWDTFKPQLGRIRGQFVPEFYTFSTRVDRLDNPEKLARLIPDGKATDIVQAVDSFKDKSDAIFVLVSDGRDNSGRNVRYELFKSQTRINTLTVGSKDTESAEIMNIVVDRIETAEDFVVNHETKVEAIIKSTALSSRVVRVKMVEVDTAGKPIGQEVSQGLTLQPVSKGQSVQLPYTPRAVGVRRLKVWVDPIVGERSVVDNEQVFQGLALDPRIKVLYVEGRARPEYTQLNRALGRDPNIEIASLLRITPERFAASGKVDGEKFTAMPASPDEWKKFDVIILGDLHSSHLTRAQQDAIEQRVSAGAGLLMIGGQSSFGPGQYANTVIEKALPVFAGDAAAPQEKSEFIPRLTEEGAPHPAMEGLAEWFGVGDKPGEKKLLPLLGNVVVSKAKSGAQIILTHHDRPGPDGKPQILLALQRYGKGRSAAFTGDTTYRWYLELRGMGQDSPYNRFWGQLVRWLAGSDEVRNRDRGPGVDGLLNKSVFKRGENVQIRARVRDEKGDATDFAAVKGTFKTRDGAPQELKLVRSTSRTGMYEGLIESPEKGDYELQLDASKDGKTLGEKQKLQFTVIAPAEEMETLAADPDLMKDLARQRNGIALPIKDLSVLLDELLEDGTREVKINIETVHYSNWIGVIADRYGKRPWWGTEWDLPMQSTVVIVLLGLEWMLRRIWQLP